MYITIVFHVLCFISNSVPVLIIRQRICMGKLANDPQIVAFCGRQMAGPVGFRTFLRAV